MESPLGQRAFLRNSRCGSREITISSRCKPVRMIAGVSVSRPSLAQYQSNLSLRSVRVTVPAPWESCHKIGTDATDRRSRAAHTSPIYMYIYVCKCIHMYIYVRFMIRNASPDTSQRLSLLSFLSRELMTIALDLG